MKEIKDIVKVACVYLTTIIGAGFASGQEIVQFFSNYYSGGFYGIILAGLLFSIIGYTVLDRVYKDRIRNYDEFLFPSVGWVIGWIMEVIVALFVLSLFCIMVAGAARIISEMFGFSFIYCIVFTAFLCMLLILTGIKGVVTFGSIVSPVLVIGMVLVGLYIIIFKDVSVFNISNFIKPLTGNWLFSSILYVSYNSILSVVVMCGMLPYLKSRRVGAIGGAVGGFLLCVVALILNTAIYMFYKEAVVSELPMLSIASKYSNLISGAYTIILLFAMLVSAVTSGYCFIERLSSKLPANTKILTIGTCALAIPMSSLGFSKLIATLYPVFGYAGMFMVFVILIQWFKTTFAERILRK